MTPPFLRDRLQERAVRVADLECLEDIAVREPALREVLLRILPLTEGPVVLIHDTREQAITLTKYSAAMNAYSLAGY